MANFPASNIQGGPKLRPQTCGYIILVNLNQFSKKFLTARCRSKFAGMIRYYTRCYFNVRSKADISQLNLPHGNDNKKSVKTEKLKSKKTDMLKSNSKQSGKST